MNRIFSVALLPRKQSYRSILRGIKLLLIDVDGVMTDGGIYFSETGDELKKFNIQDGYGIVKLQRNGVKVGILTGKVTRIVQRRAEELGITEVYQNVEHKIETYRQIKKKMSLTDREIAYIGDDEPDMEVLRSVGFSAAPADAADSVRLTVNYVCKRRGGAGAVREVAELILRSWSHGRRSAVPA